VVPGKSEGGAGFERPAPVIERAWILLVEALRKRGLVK